MTELRDQVQASLGDAYAVERELGGGGMSRVFLAEDIPLGRRVVIKVLPADFAGSVSVARFRREIALAARLQHPHIVPLLAFGEIDGLPYYTMPFVEGESLRGRLAHGELPVGEAVSVLRDVARALEYAHAKGVTHRDIKPDNVLLVGGSSSENSGPSAQTRWTTASLTDFGVAKALSDATATGTGALTSVGVALGTPAYMAPEQAAGDPSTDHRADLYAFGVMGYEMLAGHTPFAGRSMHAMLAAHATELPTPLATLRPATPVAIADLVMRCLEKRPGDRPQSAAEILNVLDSTTIAGNTGVLPRPVTSIATSTDFPRRRQIFIGGAVAVLALGALAVALWSRGQARPAIAEVRSLAVMPFDNTSRDTAFDYLEDGVSDHVRDALNAQSGLAVKARSSSRQLKGQPVHELGTRLGVAAVLQGTVSRPSSRIHVTAELVRVRDETVLWSGTFDTAPNELAVIQDSIATAVVNQLGLGRRLATASVSATASGRATIDPEAYDLFLRGRFAYDRFDLAQAEDYFRAAITRDPRFARAEGFLAMTQANMPVMGLVGLDTALMLTRATAEHALSHDSTVVEAYIAESFILASDMRLTEALAPLEKAVRLDSTSADVLLNYGLALSQVGRMEEALAHGRRARDRDPYNVNAVGVYSYILYQAGRFDEALTDARTALRLAPGNGLGYRGLGFIYSFAGMPDSALASFQQGFRLDSTTFGGRSNLIFGYAVAGRWDDAERERALLAHDRGGNSPDYYKAIVALAFGEYDAAMTALDRGVADREALFGNISIPCDPIFDPLKPDRRFASLMRRLGAQACPSRGRWPIVRRRR